MTPWDVAEKSFLLHCEPAVLSTWLPISKVSGLSEFLHGSRWAKDRGWSAGWVTESQSNFGGVGPLEGHLVWSFTQTASLHVPFLKLMRALFKWFLVVSKLKLHLKTDPKCYFFKVTNSLAKSQSLCDPVLTPTI